MPSAAPHSPGTPPAGHVRRRELLLAGGGGAFTGLAPAMAAAPVNLALVAEARCSRPVPGYRLAALHHDHVPQDSGDRRHEIWMSPQHEAEPWVEFRWPEAVPTDRIEVYWGQDSWEVSLPQACRLLAWDGQAWQPVRGDSTPGLLPDRFNEVRFEPLRTRRLRLELKATAGRSVGILQWRVWSHGAAPALPPRVVAGVDRSVVVGGASYLQGEVFALGGRGTAPVRWRKLRGPGDVVFGHPNQAETTARVAQPGDYELELAAGRSRSRLRLRAVAAPSARRLDVVYTTPYRLSSPLWRARARSLVVNWIPHCIRQCERSDLPDGQGGIDNFIEAAKALRGEPHGPHRGLVFSNAWVHQTVESICLGLMVDASDDAEMKAAQAHLRATLERWIPLLLAAQHPDGYLHTAYTLGSRQAWPERWSPSHRGEHEGYVAGYFIEAAINHHTLTRGLDTRLYDAAKRLADCWVANLGPGRRPWFDGHQQMEQALVRFGRFVNDVEGGGRGDAYVALARFLLDSRGGGNRYDQSHLPAQQQYEATGHAVRAVYQYSAMADIAAETRDPGYQSAVLSIWDNLVNRKYYVTGGVGSGETSEGFGDDHSLPHEAYCESCSSCALVFFQYKLQLAHQHARYADLYEETLYNALLGSMDLAGRHFTYTNPLVGSQRYGWHTCPCCVGNIPRTLLMLPTWSYTKDREDLFVNLYIGGRMAAGTVAGTALEVEQQTNYPWDGAVAITLHPARAASFALHLRMPDRQTSALYRAQPAVRGLRGLTLNGQPLVAEQHLGYAVIRRHWEAGDTLRFELPLPVQRVVADPRVAATRGQLALRRGPLVYSVEQADQPRLDGELAAGPLQARWQPQTLQGVVTLHGRWQDGTAMTAVPCFARMNREPQPSPAFPSGDAGYARSRVWLRYREG